MTRPTTGAYLDTSTRPGSTRASTPRAPAACLPRTGAFQAVPGSRPPGPLRGTARGFPGGGQGIEDER